MTHSTNPPSTTNRQKTETTQAIHRQPALNRQIFRLYLKSSLRFRKDAILSLLNPIGAILTNVGVPFFAGKALASVIQSDGSFKQHMVSLIITAVLAAIANRVGFSRVLILSAKVQSYLHAMAFRKLLERGSSFHSNRISGKLVSDALDFVNSYATLANSVYNSGLSLLVVLIAGLIVITISSWQLGLFVGTTVLIILLWALRESGKREALRFVRLAATKKLTGHLSDSIVNAQTVKTFAGEDKEIRINSQLNDKLRDLRIADWNRAANSGNNRVIVLLTTLVLLLLLIEHLAETSPTSLSTGIFAFTYTFTLLLRLFEINTLTRQVEESLLNAAPIAQMLVEPNEVNDATNAKKLKVKSGKIELQAIQFKYIDSSGAQNVFDNFNLTVKPGEKIGLVGPSGSGKTTLTRLLLRFEDIQAGSILIDGQPIAGVTQTSLRQAIAYVPQEPLLFHRTIRENIAYGNPDATDEQVEQAARQAYAHDFITGLHDGYETVVGERGVKLSGGQRQRIAIARAIVKDAPILLLDEATSALDSESEGFIQDALQSLMQDRTTLVIAHRLSTVQKMDRIIVLEDGVITEEGSHRQLIRKQGTYARLWNHQSGGFIED